MPLLGCENSSAPDTSRPASLTNAASPKSIRRKSKTIVNAISSPVSVAGAMPCASPDGQTTNQSIPAHVPVSRFRARDSEKAMPTNATSGPLFTHTSLSAKLQLSLENRLRARLDVNGSPEYVLTWKIWDMPSGVPICALRASVRPWSANACIGWPRPLVPNGGRRPKGGSMSLTGKTPDGKKRQVDVEFVAKTLLGWPRPTAITNTGGAALCKWGGTASREKLIEAVGNSVLNGALNPAFPCWLMGYPDEWLSCADSAMRSSRNSRRSSSRQQ